ncbi:MAG: branched-chain amino acid ABC transporter permease [Rhizobiales bacterium]|nr:branched-chain amino acid ABC transporter permease [Hyphomicrobiales bacterium]
MRENRLSLILLVIGLSLLMALPWLAKATGSPATIGLATRILIYAIAAASLNLVLGFGGMVSFGHAAFFGLGGYVVGILYHHFIASEPLFGVISGSNALLITLPAAMLVTGLMAAAIGALSLRTSGVQFIMITLAFAQMLFFFFAALKVYGGDDGLIIRRRNTLFDFNMRDDVNFYFLCLFLMGAVFFLKWRIVNSRFGRALSAIRQNERRMQASGLSPYGYKLVAFILSGIGTGLAGALMANYLRFVSPDMLHWTKSGELMIMVILGGVGTIFGPFFGAGALVLLETGLAGITEHWQVILGPILLIVVLFRADIRGLVARWAGRRA